MLEGTLGNMLPVNVYEAYRVGSQTHNVYVF